MRWPRGQYRPKSIAELGATANQGPKALGLPRIVESLLVLAGAGHVSPAQDASATQAAKPRTDALNAHLMERAIYSGDATFLASPLIAGGVSVGRFHQLFLRAIRQGAQQPEAWANQAWQAVAAQGQRLLKDGKTLETPDENLAELTRQAQEFEQKRLPVLRALAIG